jgi:hypothetical protein
LHLLRVLGLLARLALVWRPAAIGAEHVLAGAARAGDGAVSGQGAPVEVDALVTLWAGQDTCTGMSQPSV